MVIVLNYQKRLCHSFTHLHALGAKICSHVIADKMQMTAGI